MAFPEKIVDFIRQRYGAEIAKKWHHNDPFKVLISCVLSQRTREENTDAASKALFSVASTPEEIFKLSIQKLKRLIKKAGLVEQKAPRIKEICKIILEKYGGDVPAAREALMELPGVGPKTADVTLCYGFGKPSIPVDTHVNRISKRLGFVDEKAELEEVQSRLRLIFKKKDWRLINRGFVLFGREMCLPRYPKCENCPLKIECKFAEKSLFSRSD